MLQRMRAVVITRPGGPEVLELREVPDPRPGPAEIVVSVKATALNRADLLQRRGLYPAPPGVPADIPGLEMAGTVESCGAGASRFRPGDRVMAILGGGGHAEKVALDERVCLPIPDGMDWAEAGAVPEAFLTAWDALHDRGGLRAGDILLLHAAGSGVGTAAAQLARVAGARVIGLSRSADKRRRLEALGLDAVLDPTAPGLAAAIRDAVRKFGHAAGPVGAPARDGGRDTAPTQAGGAESGSACGSSSRVANDRSAQGPTEGASGGEGAGATADREISPSASAVEPGAGVDLVVDFLGASSWPINMEVLAPQGRLVLVGTMGGAKVTADLSILMRKRLTVVGTVLRARSIVEKAALAEAFARGGLPLLAAGRLRPIVDRVMPLADAATAHEIMERNENFGKIVLRPARQNSEKVPRTHE